MNDFQPNQDICLVPYYPAYEIALPWYQDAELCHHVDNQGDLFYIEYKGILCGDVCLQTSGEISIVVCKEYQNRHIGRTVIGKILALAKEKKYPQCYAEIYSFNKQSRKMFESIGFVQNDAETFVYTLE